MEYSETNKKTAEADRTHGSFSELLRASVSWLFSLFTPAANDFFTLSADRRHPIRLRLSLFCERASAKLDALKAIFKKNKPISSRLLSAAAYYGAWHLAAYFLVVFVIITLSILSNKNNAHVVYGHMGLLAFFTITLLFAFNHSVSKNSASALLVTVLSAVLIAYGYLLQAMYGASNSFSLVDGVWLDTEGALSKTRMTSLAGLLIAAVFLYVLTRFIDARRQHFVIFLSIAGVCAAFILLRILPATNGAHLFIRLGKFTLQVTEFIKVIDVLILAMLFTNKDLTDERKFLISLIVMGINIFGFLICNEIGTLVVVMLAYILMLFIGMRTKYAVVTVSALLVCVAVIWGVSTHAYNKTHPRVDPDTITDEDILGEWNTEEEHELLLQAALAVKESELYKQKYESAGALTRFFSDLYETKIDARILSHYREKTEENAGQIDAGETQVQMMRKAISRAGPFGTRNASVLNNIPEASRELIFLYALMQNGYLIAALVVLCYAGLWFTVIFGSAALNRKYFLMNLGIAVLLIGQSVIEILVSLDCLPLVGIGSAYLSDGGTGLAVNLAITAFVIWSMRSKKGAVRN